MGIFDYFGFGRKPSPSSSEEASAAPKRQTPRPQQYMSLNQYLSLRGYTIEDLQLKAYEILWDSIHASSFIEQMTHLTINTGLSLESTPVQSVLGITSDEAQTWAAKVEDRFRVWQDQKECDYTGRNNFRQFQIAEFWTKMLLGEHLSIIRYSTDENRLNPVSIQAIPPTMITDAEPADYERVRRANGDIVDGIEIDSKGMEVAVYLEVSNADGNASSKRFPYFGQRSGRQMIIHGYTAREPGRYRGIPILAKVFNELKKIADAQIFELGSMAANATILGSIEREQPVNHLEKLSSVLEDVGSESTANAMSCGTNPLSSDKIDVSKGGVFLQNLEAGEKLSVLKTDRPNLNIPEFINQLFQWIGPAVGLPASVWKMQFSQNYSASKGELELAWRNMDVHAAEFSADFNRVVYEAWLQGEIGKGEVSVSNWSDPYSRAAWSSASWGRIPIPALNPLQEAKASTELVGQGFSTREREAQRRTGSSFTNNVDRLGIENEALAEANASLSENEESVDGSSEPENED